MKRLAIALSASLLAGLVLVSPTTAAGDDAVVSVVFTPDDMGFTATSSKEISNVIVQLCGGATHKHDNLTAVTFTHTETALVAGVWVKSGNNAIGGSAPSGAGQRFDNAGVACVPVSTSSSSSAPPTTPPVSTPPEPTPPPTTPPAVLHTICHATGSTTHPFEVISPSVEAVFNGHLGGHHHGGHDIIPPFTYNGTVYSQNWNAANEAVFDNGCMALTSTPPVSTPPESTPPVSTPPETTPPVSTPPQPTPPPEIPVFPSWSSLALGVLGALGGAFAILRRKLA